MASVTSPAALASDLRSVLSVVPAPMLASRSGLIAGSIDLRALSATGESARERLVPIVTSDTVQAFFWKDGADWRSKSGVAASDLSGFLVFGDAPSTVTLWRFAAPGKAAALLRSLAGKGFTRNDDGTLSNGEPFKIDPARRDPADPFLGPLGRASTFGAAGGGVVQSASPKIVSYLQQPEPGASLADEPPVAAALTGLEAAAGSARIPQAVLLGEAALVAAPKGSQAEGGVPPVRAIVIADIEEREAERRGAVVALGYADCEAARMASKAFADAWSTAPDRSGKPGAERTGAEAATRVVPSNGACAAVITLAKPVAGQQGNAVYRYIVQALMQRDFRALQGR
ncbi:hypothetical protein [Enterovirga rhinocerotis]|uniref:hypothetical protein n=1 Tax=Enterovirga rhinocerotis TaxID=1339210 RepID=UPI00105E2A48|nr:hypothetical protein [Enterovirga rhinocerotis]